MVAFYIVWSHRGHKTSMKTNKSIYTPPLEGATSPILNT